MKKHHYLLAIIFLTITTTGWCNDKTIFSASAITVDSIMNYYSSMANLKNLDQFAMEKKYCAGLCQYMNQNRDAIITRVAESKSYNNLGRAAQIINSLYKNQTAYYIQNNLQLSATAQGYFDSMTGHRYYKTSATTYAEYSKKGVFLKTIPSDKYLLTKNRNIHPITKNNYILYQQTLQGKANYLTLPANEKPPKGWEAETVLFSLN